ncbi:hypothetical protein BN946_scf184817.g23 [Trametes cinnabarina]|uniref:Uncharacterized protein n=1 Tax=Pycnoporus cinnabarinus TaxID=5643 RepID=A0A060SAP5_PYCCI|nr:hypothetical protein BN946_scf184817.g23 [Trametes cinnabarina]
MSYAIFEQYKIPRSQVDVEALAQVMFRYLRLTAEDSEILSRDPTARDALIAELYANPEVKPTFMPSDVVGDNLPLAKYDEYLEQVDAAIERYTPPRSLRDRVLRYHLVAAALNVFRQYKFFYALNDHRDLGDQVFKRYRKLFKDWMHTEFPLISGRPAPQAAPTQAKRPPRAQQTSTPPTPISAYGMTKDTSTLEDSEYLDSPHKLLLKKFQHSPPPGQEQEYKGRWEMESYSTRVQNGHIVHEYVIALEALNGAALPMSRDEVAFLLSHSTVVA